MNLPLYLTNELRSILTQNPALSLNQEFRQYLIETIQHYQADFERNFKLDPVAALKEIYRAMAANSKKNGAKGVKKSCQKGCDFCCHIPVVITELEARVLLAYADKENIVIDEDYLLRQNAINGKDRLKSNVSACVFLKNHQCTVYDARPLTCRKYYVYSDPQYCNTKKYPGNQRVEIALDMDTEILMSAILPLIVSDVDTLGVQLLKVMP